MNLFKIVSVLFVAALFSVLFSSSILNADESIMTHAQALKLGYRPVGFPLRNLAVPVNVPFGAHSLVWPVKFQDAAHTVGQNFVNYQFYGDPAYFHGGCDLRTDDAAAIVAMVAGKLEGGYYTYSNNPDGSLQKYWTPLNGPAHDDPYFELGIVTDDGFRFEFHHVNSLTLPAATLELIRTHGRVASGQVIGFVNGGPFPGYEHTHYNMIDPQGVRLNPEHYSAALADHTPPKILSVYAISANGQASEIKSGARLKAGTVKKFVVLTTESHDGDAYVQTPPYVAIQFSQSASGYVWDFRQFLLAASGGFPDIREVFTPSLKVGGWKSVETSGQFGQGQFLMNLPVSAPDQGAFQITVGDDSGNNAVFVGELTP